MDLTDSNAAVDTPPKLFISYSWSNPAHERWVLNLADELVQSGIHVIIDKWDLKEGHDAHAFMEQMVTDPDIKKVVLVLDTVYAAKADGREGGVGTETQILTPQLYGKREQDKFVAVISEKNEAGKPFLPAYYSSRIYIDLSEPDRYASEFERLVRWVFDKPLYRRPELSKRPAFLDEDDNAISLGTSALFRRAIDALKNEKGYASAALEEYLDTFSQNLERFRINDFDGEFDNAVIASIEAFTPHRNELIQMFSVLSQYAPSSENIQELHKFFEKLIPYLNVLANVNSYREWDYDNYRFIIHELYLYALAILIKNDRFEQTARFLNEQYYVGNSRHYGNQSMIGNGVFLSHMKSLEYRNNRLRANRLSIRADLLKERCVGTGIEFNQLMQADFILYLRGELQRNGGFFTDWWPYTLLYVGRFYSSFEIFSRAVSQRYFNKIKVLLGIEKPEDLAPLLSAIRKGERRVPQWQFDSFDPVMLLNYEQLAKNS